jgi:hypothetical protein
MILQVGLSSRELWQAFLCVLEYRLNWSEPFYVPGNELASAG